MAVQTVIKNQKVHVGDTIKVHQRIVEEEKTRTQVFEGIVISIKGHEHGKSFTVRKIATGNIGVERIWPVVSPNITKIEVVKKGKVRRSKLYYLRARKGKQALKIRSADELKVTDRSKVKATKPKKTATRAKKTTGKTRRRPRTKTSKK